MTGNAPLQWCKWLALSDDGTTPTSTPLSSSPPTKYYTGFHLQYAFPISPKIH